MSSRDEAIRVAGRHAGVPHPPKVRLQRTGFLLSTVGRAREGLERALEPVRIKPHHYGLLVVLSEQGPLPQQTAGQTLEIDKSTMVVFVDQLEQRGLVERQRNPQNRRAYQLTMTAAGRAVLAQAEGQIRAMEAAVLAPLDGEQRRHLQALLLQLVLGASARNAGAHQPVPACHVHC